MKKRCSVFGALCGVLSVLFCSQQEGVLLKLDYGKQPQWLYSIEYKSQGNFTQGDSTTQLTNAVSCLLSGSAAETGKLIVKTDNIAVTSDILSDEETQKLAEKLSSARYSLQLDNGQPSIDTSADLPAGSFPEWDVYTQLAKMLPSLPEKPIKPGFTWERTVTLPIKTLQGTIPCEVYRSYTFDSLSASLATISWKFRYSAEEEAPQHDAAMKQIPIAGTGAGSAQIDLGRNIIVRAEMDFATPVATIGELQVTWQERAVMTYEQGK